MIVLTGSVSRSEKLTDEEILHYNKEKASDMCNILISLYLEFRL